MNIIGKWVMWSTASHNDFAYEFTAIKHKIC